VSRSTEKEIEKGVDEQNRLMRGGPTVAAALVCFVSGVFSITFGLSALLLPKDLVGIFLISPIGSSGTQVSSVFELSGIALTVLGIVYIAAGIFLWSPKMWARGAYLGIIVSIVGTIISGVSVTYEPGIAAAGLVVNILIITMIATETWEERLQLSQENALGK
jgi:hypothetical protein